MENMQQKVSQHRLEIYLRNIHKMTFWFKFKQFIYNNLTVHLKLNHPQNGHAQNYVDYIS